MLKCNPTKFNLLAHENKWNHFREGSKLFCLRLFYFYFLWTVCITYYSCLRIYALCWVPSWCRRSCLDCCLMLIMNKPGLFCRIAATCQMPLSPVLKLSDLHPSQQISAAWDEGYPFPCSVQSAAVTADERNWWHGLHWGGLYIRSLHGRGFHKWQWF